MRRPGTKTVLAALATIVALAVHQHSRADDVLIWSDEFDGTSIGPANWEHMIGDGTAYGLPPGWGNNELQYYTHRAENSFVAGGYLHIVAREEAHMGSDYTSARLRSLNRQDFLYGRLEARMQLPTGQGIWPAFWMLPSTSTYGGWASSGEIDIMETVNIPTTIHGTIWFGGAWPGQVSATGTYSSGTDYSTGFHIYTLEWEPDVMRWYVDGVLYSVQSSATWFSEAAPGNNRAPFDQPFHFLMNVAVGGQWPGPPDATTVFPQELLVDWVRVYQMPAQEPFYADPHTIPGRIEAEDFDEGYEGVAYHDCDPTNNGGAYRTDQGVDLENCVEGGFDVGWICPGEWMEYAVDVVSTATYTIEVRVASFASGGTFRLEFDGVDKTGDVTVPATGGWQNWVTVTASADLTGGVGQMRFVNTGAAGQEFNLNHFDFTVTCTKGDVNQDTLVNGNDVERFAQTLLGVYPTGSVEFCSTDMDDDGDLEITDDITIFINCLLATSCP